MFISTKLISQDLILLYPTAMQKWMLQLQVTFQAYAMLMWRLTLMEAIQLPLTGRKVRFYNKSFHYSLFCFHFSWLIELTIQHIILNLFYFVLTILFKTIYTRKLISKSVSIESLIWYPSDCYGVMWQKCQPWKPGDLRQLF